MRQFFVFILCVLGLFIAGASFAALNINETLPGVAERGGYQTAGVTDTSLSQTVGRIIKVALSLVGTIFLALTVYAGFLWMTAGGNDEQVEKATKIFRASIIGLIIVLAGYSLTTFVLRAIISSAVPGGAVGGASAGESFWDRFSGIF